MKVVYFSVTGQTRRFASKISSCETLEIDPSAGTLMKEPYVLVVPTYEEEFITPVFDFLETGENQEFLAGVSGSGNRNFAELFVFSARDIARRYGVPLIYAFEFSGTKEDVENFEEEVRKLERKTTMVRAQQ
ncbi:class Ib ribonucleoside-diphosphate reductase assembly flavoprotein NrdI [Ligilactobacillus sp.]|uniref:class Ib ribonucleoside-diphosphate reductase assembly flavoprotein NrdI n=1 Tax=Ligilactobacillus sp. TaxID=2767921 RepID=UPI002FDFD2D5